MLLRYTNIIPHANQSEFSNQNLLLDNHKEQLNIGYFMKSEKKELILDNLDIEFEM